jgi:aminopeptidase C
MKYLVASAVRKKVNESGKQIGKDGLYVLDVKVEEYLNKLVCQFNGHKARITPELIRMIKL